MSKSVRKFVATVYLLAIAVFVIMFLPELAKRIGEMVGVILFVCSIVWAIDNI